MDSLSKRAAAREAELERVVAQVGHAQLTCRCITVMYININIYVERERERERE